MQQLLLQRREEALGNAVVLAILSLTRATHDTSAGENLAVIAGLVRASPITMMDQTRRRIMSTERHVQSPLREDLVVALTHRLADHLAAIQVDHLGHVQQPLACRYELHISFNPLLVGSVGGEVSCEHVGRHRVGGARARSATEGLDRSHSNAVSSDRKFALVVLRAEW